VNWRRRNFKRFSSRFTRIFYFNALNAISALIDENPRAADRMVNSLSEFLRRLLREDRTQEVPIKQEIDFTLLYVDIMKVRFEDRLAFHLRCDAGLKMLSCRP
jgi:LytS/YehU family sensor histidine kinase